MPILRNFHSTLPLQVGTDATHGEQSIRFDKVLLQQRDGLGIESRDAIRCRGVDCLEALGQLLGGLHDGVESLHARCAIFWCESVKVVVFDWLEGVVLVKSL
jgi:hypothetical protein